MINPSDIIIPLEKLTEYLLVPRVHNDKSKFLAQAGFTIENPDVLEQAIRDLFVRNEVVQERENRYGIFYRLSGELVGPSGILSVITIWIVRAIDGEFRFVTLKPDKG